ncbi:oxaloacetate-decarboxylating malate dehydrogenase [Amantichitinum ursilacus]|uniref:NAD-dependent malic enzyme n=1 Tax=Amantichitinum ursilacus TaxID=857265 RepID=A0A0N0GPQ1_9NEIS|nr:oxaloacetate-decarboxylating malate dehydrogenase [Amantichitinum ursilacus]KPC53924.1 NAD-dependent malic enzyme [Amantichitinum ursilacus]
MNNPAPFSAPVHETIETALAGYQLLADPLLNKGTAFSDAERSEFDLHGLLPPHIATLQEQVTRRIEALRAMPDHVSRQVFLREIQDSNEALFYAILTTDLEEWLPVVHVPTVAHASRHFSRHYRRPRGLFLGYPQRAQMARMLSQPHLDQIETIVISDGEHVAGLGDQGANAMAMSIGAASLHSACAGLDPATVLPILLDLGTDNPACLEDPLYVGWRHARVRGAQREALIDHLIDTVRERWPHVVVQWENLAHADARRVLARRRGDLCMFSNNIQGTAVVALATMLSALQTLHARLAEQRIVIFGAGAAGTGIARLLVVSLMQQGLTSDQAHARVWLIDREGLLINDPTNPFARAASEWPDYREGGAMITLRQVIDAVHPSVLIGTSGQAGAFDEASVRSMAQHCQQPVILPLSNPGSHCEAIPADLLAWTEGKALVGTGSPFAPVTINGQQRVITQSNNAYAFPGLALGAVAVKASALSDGMLLAAAQALAELRPAGGSDHGLLPPINTLREVARRVAVAVGEQAIRDGLAQDDGTPVALRVQRKIWAPHYRAMRRVYPVVA